ACWPAVRAQADGDDARARHKVSAATLFDALAARFPLRLGLVPLLQLEVGAPRLLLLPARNRLGATLRADLAAAGAGALVPGELDLVFALRYEPGDRSVRAHQPEALEVRWPGLPPQGRQALQSVLPALLREVGEIVLHRLTPRQLALPDTMGLAPQELQVVDDGLLVFFGPK